MKARVVDDTYVRTINIAITDAQTMNDDSATWRSRPRPFYAERMEIKIRSGVVDTVTVSGPLVLAGGKLSKNTVDRITWRTDTAFRNSLNQAPEWVRTITTRALQGVTAWTWPLGEVK